MLFRSLLSTTESVGTVSYQHDVRGNMVFLPHLYNDFATPSPTPNVTVDFRDQMVRAQLNADDYAIYHYDANGQRVRKVVKKGGTVEERIYVDGYEVWRKSTSGTPVEERQTVHVQDGETRIAMLEMKTVSGGSAVPTPTAVVRMQMGNHLGTALLELTEEGEIISYEEYHPYGSTAWWSGDAGIDVSRKRYRYTGMERDEETGLQCHGVRYYAVWLGRWTSADPIGLGDGVNRYGYCHGRPVGGRDPGGMGTISNTRLLDSRRSDSPAKPTETPPTNPTETPPAEPTETPPPAWMGVGNPEGTAGAAAAAKKLRMYISVPGAMEVLSALPIRDDPQKQTIIQQVLSTPDVLQAIADTGKARVLSTEEFTEAVQLGLIAPQSSAAADPQHGFIYINPHGSGSSWEFGHEVSHLQTGPDIGKTILKSVLYGVNTEIRAAYVDYSILQLGIMYISITGGTSANDALQTALGNESKADQYVMNHGSVKFAMEYLKSAWLQSNGFDPSQYSVSTNSEAFLAAVQRGQVTEADLSQIFRAQRN